MRRIARHISLLICIAWLLACGNETTTQTSQLRSISYLHALCHSHSVLITDDIVIRGHITANDIYNEISNTIVVSDDTAGIEIAIEGDDLYRTLPLFGEVSIRCAGLTLARDNGCPILGLAPTSYYAVDRIDSHAIDNYLSIAITEQPMNVAICNIAEITTAELLRYVAVERVSFIDEEQGQTWCERDTTTLHRYKTTIRHLCNGCDTLRVVVSGDCDYAATTLPSGILRCEGIIDTYNDDVALRIINYGVVEI